MSSRASCSELQRRSALRSLVTKLRDNAELQNIYKSELRLRAFRVKTKMPMPPFEGGFRVETPTLLQDAKLKDMTTERMEFIRNG